MVTESLTDDLAILDCLELFNSTVVTAEVLGISQSSCSRRYRSFSQQFDLDFDRTDGHYQANKNLDVLHSLRQAAQKRRIRKGQYRFNVGWQVHSLFVPTESDACQQLSLSPMDSWRMTSLLEQRLVDFWLGGLLELTPLLDTSLGRLRSQRVSLGQSLMCVPLCRWPIQVLSHSDHPLQQQAVISSEDLARYPSPSLAMGMAPQLMRHLQQHGLASTPSGLLNHDWALWQGRANDGLSLSYGGPHDEERAASEGVKPLGYPLNLIEVGAVIGHHEAIEDSSFTTNLKQMAGCLRNKPIAKHPALEWII